jgi:hypothetical protein
VVSRLFPIRQKFVNLPRPSLSRYSPDNKPDINFSNVRVKAPPTCYPEIEMEKSNCPFPRPVLAGRDFHFGDAIQKRRTKSAVYLEVYAARKSYITGIKTGLPASY